MNLAMSKDRLVIKWVAAAVISFIVGASFMSGASAAEKLKVGFVYLGPVGDLSGKRQ
jgi:basic membrane lipoprotein Med (substrate-binding protein (PBP1-ABC) superfamily)